MSSSEQVCALSGCQNPLDEVGGGRARKYCCSAHRKAARQRRIQAVPADAGPVATATSRAPTSSPSGGSTAQVDRAAAHVRARPVGGEPVARVRPPAAESVARVAAPPAEKPATPYRRLVPAPPTRRFRWFRPSSPQPHASRGVRPAQRRRFDESEALLPDWLQAPPSPPAAGPSPAAPSPAEHTAPAPAPSPAEQRPAAPAPAPRPAVPPAPVARATPVPTVRATPATKSARAAATARPAPTPTARPAPTARADLQTRAGVAQGRAGAEPRDRPDERRERKARRRAEAAAGRREAAAVLSGRPIPRRSERAVELVAVAPAVFLGQFREALRAALHSLSNNRLRSLLTTVGIVVGVAAVIVLVALGNGMKAQFNDQFSKLANQITVTPVSGGVASGGVARRLTDQDVTALQDPRQAPDVASVSPSMTGSVTLTVGQVQERAGLVGATENYLELLDRKIAAGSWLTSAQIAGNERRAVLGRQAVALLWGPGADLGEVVGSTIRVSRSSFRVVGVLDSDGQDDNVVIVPFGTSRAYLVGNNAGEVDQIIVKSTSVGTVDRAAGEVTDVLDGRHYIKAAADRDFNVRSFTQLLNKSTQFINFLTMFIVAVAAISLLVGGIGVANIMLVSVTERTREIGIRKAVGAPRRAILRQFLSEAVMLTGLGGVIGVVIGVGVALAGGNLVPRWIPEFPTPVLTVAPVLVAFGVSLAIGVLAGGYPANRAARMRPIEALRFE
jgi:putative ABC transport system permease protein